MKTTNENEKTTLKATLNKKTARKRSDKKSAFKYTPAQKRTLTAQRKMIEKSIIGPTVNENPTEKLAMANVVYCGLSIVPSVAVMAQNAEHKISLIENAAIGSDNQTHVTYHSYRAHPKCPKCDARIYTDVMGRTGTCKRCGTKIVKNPGMTKWAVAE